MNREQSLRSLLDEFAEKIKITTTNPQIAFPVQMGDVLYVWANLRSFNIESRKSSNVVWSDSDENMLSHLNPIIEDWVSKLQYNKR